jgi:4-hydroxybenzoate polyprenyltransferase
VKDLFISLRPKQWTKNVLVFAGLVFARDIFHAEKLLSALLAFILFCTISSSGYLINDVLDREKDSQHPKKRVRPIAAGRVSPATAITIAVILGTTSLIASFSLNVNFGVVITSYFVLTSLYSLYLKNIVIVDVMIISSGFMFRAIGGAMAIRELSSSWLIICTIFLALFFALNKRKAEFLALKDDATAVRQTLGKYSEKFLDQMINTVSTGCIIAYALYTLDPETVAKFSTRNLVFTLVFVIYGLFRYLYLVSNRSLGESPELVILADKPILICIFLYAVTVFLAIYL